MTTGFLEGLIKPEVNTDIDMSSEKNTYNIGNYIERVEVKIDKLIVTDKEIAEHFVKMLAQHSALDQQPNIQPTE